jgi:hypothetical protein
VKKFMPLWPASIALCTAGTAPPPQHPNPTTPPPPRKQKPHAYHSTVFVGWSFHVQPTCRWVTGCSGTFL